VGVAPAIPRYIVTREEADNYIIAHVKCLEDLIKEYDASIIFLPSSVDDIETCKTIIANISDKYGHHVRIIVTNSLDEYEYWIRKLDLLITTRMHPSLIASRNFTPFLSIIYDHKQIGFLEQIGLKDYSLRINEVSYYNLKSKINHLIANWCKVKESLEYTVPKLCIESTAKIRSVFISIIRK